MTEELLYEIGETLITEIEKIQDVRYIENVNDKFFIILQDNTRYLLSLKKKDLRRIILSDAFNFPILKDNRRLRRKIPQSLQEARGAAPFELFRNANKSRCGFEIFPQSLFASALFPPSVLLIVVPK